MNASNYLVIKYTNAPVGGYMEKKTISSVPALLLPAHKLRRIAYLLIAAFSLLPRSSLASPTSLPDDQMYAWLIVDWVASMLRGETPEHLRDEEKYKKYLGKYMGVWSQLFTKKVPIPISQVQWNELISIAGETAFEAAKKHYARPDEGSEVLLLLGEINANIEDPILKNKATINGGMGVTFETGRR
jgi:hypothetical protein